MVVTVGHPLSVPLHKRAQDPCLIWLVLALRFEDGHAIDMQTLSSLELVPCQWTEPLIP